MELIAQPFRTFALMLLLCISCLAIEVRAEGDVPLVLLTNGNVLRGIPQVQGNLVILVRDDGTQMRIRRDQVAFSADSMRQLYEHRVGQLSFRSAAIFADDVGWCLRNNLIDEAEAELNKLKAMDPSYPSIPRLHRQIESARSPRSAAPVQAVNLAPDEPMSMAEKFDAPSGITPAAVASFATRVQPMLINRCSNAGCHRTGSETKWQLSHLGVSVRVSSKMTQRNLQATVPHLDFDNPNTSELLRYLLTPHAEGRYDISGRSAQSAEATLRGWLSQLGRYPQPFVPGSLEIGHSDLPMPVSPTGYARWPSGNSTVAPVASAETNELAVNKEDVPDGFAIDDEGQLIYDPDGEFRKTSDSRPKRLPAIEDPFSADLFNRQNKLTVTTK